MKPDTFGLHGKTSDLALTLPPKLTYEEVRDDLRLIGRMGRALGWWATDALLYADTHFDEGKFSQLADELGYAPHTLESMMSVGRAWAAPRRRAGLDFGHHAALTSLEREDQDHWAGLAEAGDTLENGEHKRWSVTRLRQELRALTPPAPRQTAAAKTAGVGTTVASAPAAACGSPDVRKSLAYRPIPSLVREQMIEFDDWPGRYRIVGIYKSPGEVLIKTVEV